MMLLECLLPRVPHCSLVRSWHCLPLCPTCTGGVLAFGTPFSGLAVAVAVAVNDQAFYSQPAYLLFGRAGTRHSTSGL